MGQFGIDRYGRPVDYSQQQQNPQQQSSAQTPAQQSQQATTNQQTYTQMGGTPQQNTNSQGVATQINQGYTPPTGATRNEWGYYQLPNGNLAPGQNTPGSLGFTPVDSNGGLLPPDQLNPMIQHGLAGPNAVAPPTTPGAAAGPAGPRYTNTAPSAGAFHSSPLYTPSQLSYNAPSYNPYQFQFSQAPTAYQAGQVSQFTAPDQSGINSQQQGLVSQLLAHPQSLSPDIINAMKEKEKEQQLSMQQQAMGTLNQNAARNGMLGSGPLAAQQQSAQEQMIAQLTGGYRDIDLAAAQTNRTDELNALQSAEQFQQGQMGRATQGYQATLSGQMAQQQLYQAASQSQMQLASLLDQRQQLQAQEHQFGANYELSRQKSVLDAAIANEQNKLASSQQALSQSLAQAEYDEKVRQFNAQQQQQLNQLNEIARRNDYDMGTQK